MQEITKTKLRNLQKLKTMMINQAKKTGLMENFIYVRTWESYLDQLKMCEDLYKAVEDGGYMIDVPAGKDCTKMAVNPAVAEYNRMASLANKTTTQLLAMIKEAEKNTAAEPQEDDEL